MKPSMFLFSVAIAGSILLPVEAGVFEQNSAKGLWQLDGSLESRWSCQPALVTQGFTISGLPGSRFVGGTYLDLGSSTAPFGGLKQAERLMVPNPTGPNGPAGATGTHNWTLIMDVRLPSITGWTALMQSDGGNSDDAEIFLRSSRDVYLIGSSPFGAVTNPLALNTWHRLAFRAEYSLESNTQILRAYFNGAVTAQTAGNGFTAPLNGRYSLSSRVMLFSDENNETARMDVGSVAFWGRALSDADIASIGTWDADGIDWPNITPPNSCPPIPNLTGIMKFGLFQASYSPNQAAIAATASPPSIPGTVAQVQIALGSNGGTIPGMPNHRFGGTITAHVQTTGDVTVTQTVNVNYSGGPDIASASGVSFTRNGITLGSTGARGNAQVILPAGFGVALTPLGKNTLVKANIGNVGLGQSLVPVLTANLTRSSFTSDLSSSVLYPIADRIPVRFATNSILWNPSNGEFTFTPAEDLVYHREPQLGILLNQILSGHPGAANPASNEFYFLAAKQATGTVTIGARPNGAASMKSVTMTLDPNKFGTGTSTVWMHYPLLPITWNDMPGGSQIKFTNDAIDLASSKLTGATIAGTAYLQGVPNVDCPDTPGATTPPLEGMHFMPANGEWRFTPDGGLHAAGTVQATATSTAPLSVEWGAYVDTFGLQRFAHKILTGFTAGRVSTAGVFGQADQLTGLAEYEKPAALFFSGYSSPANATLLERPGTGAYYNGLADYPGFNLRCTPGSFTAVSRLADKDVPAYPLAAEAKYVLRPSGVTGRHLTAPGAPNIMLNAFGAVFNLTALNLAFLDGINVASGVNGTLDTGPPASFDLTFKGLKFGAQGQLHEASIASPQEDKTLGEAYWGLTFTPLALEFPQPKVCPAPNPDKAFIKVSAKATLTGLSNQPMIGNISILNGNIVTEGDDVAKGNAPVSRFSPGPLLTVRGPANQPDWNVNPVTDVSINKFEPLPSGTTNGTLTVGGLMDVPFFTDMPVILSTNSTNSTNPPVPPALPPQLYVRKPWEPLTTLPYDEPHRGAPGGVTLVSYRTSAQHDPIAERKWQGLIGFNFPVELKANQVFVSRTPVTDDLLLFKLTQAVKTMTPETAELIFDASGELSVQAMIPQINVASLLQDAGLAGFTGSVKDGLTGAVNSVTGLDALLKDHTQDMLKPGLATIANSAAGSSYLSQLGAAADRSAELDKLADKIRDDVALQFGPAASGINGRWRRDLLAEVTKARQGMEAAKNLIQSVAELKKLATAIGLKINLSGNPANPEPTAWEALKALFDQVIAQLQATEAALASSGELNSALITALGDKDLVIKPIVQKAINDLRAKWAPPNPAFAHGFYSPINLPKFQADLAAALTDRFSGSTFAGKMTQLLRQYAGDPQTLARQGVDDLLRMAEQMVPSSLNDLANPEKALGPLKDYLAAAQLRGYARINGDALHELRLDGHARLKVPDEMKFDAWFLLRDLDSTTPGSKCLVQGGAEAEVGMGASAELDWAGQKTAISAGGKVAMGSNGLPVGMSGDFAFTGDFLFSEVVEINDLKLGFGFGANNGYVYGRGTGKLYAMSVSAGVFAGQTCDLAAIRHADEDIGTLITDVSQGNVPIKGAMVYAEGGMSLMPLIGIPPSCVLDLRVHGGQGYFYFQQPSQEIAGVKILQGVSGELLCLVDVSGKFNTVIAGVGTILGGSPQLSNLAGQATAKVKGKVGIGWFSYTFSKTVRLKVTAPPLKYKLDY